MLLAFMQRYIPARDATLPSRAKLFDIPAINLRSPIMTRERKRDRSLTSLAPSSEALSEHDETRFRRTSRAKANLYDAVAGEYQALQPKALANAIKDE
jgi:hypothetical protein